MSKRHRILIATDGSPSAQAALETAVKFPWASSSKAAVVVARPDTIRRDSDESRVALTHYFRVVSDGARRALSTRWKNVEIRGLDKLPFDAIVAEARRFNASMIVLGWRGHGTFQRLLAGSVSRAVAAHATCPVLIVHNAPRAVRRLVVGFDGSDNSKIAVDFLRTLEPARGSSVVLVNVVEPVYAPASLSLLPASTRAYIQHEAVALSDERERSAQRTVDAAVSRLKRTGWTAKREIRVGAPLDELLIAATRHRADVLVLGARATSGLKRALLGSVANGALNRSTMPVLLVRD